MKKTFIANRHSWLCFCSFRLHWFQCTWAETFVSGEESVGHRNRCPHTKTVNGSFIWHRLSWHIHTKQYELWQHWPAFLGFDSSRRERSYISLDAEENACTTATYLIVISKWEFIKLIISDHEESMCRRGDVMTIVRCVTCAVLVYHPHYTSSSS